MGQKVLDILLAHPQFPPFPGEGLCGQGGQIGTYISSPLGAQIGPTMHIQVEIR